jgi:hypothetical protein
MMDEDRWYALAKSQQSVDWQAGFDAAKAEYVPVLMAHLRILADLRAQVMALPDEHHYGAQRGGCVKRADVLNLIDRSGE